MPDGAPRRAARAWGARLRALVRPGQHDAVGEALEVDLLLRLRQLLRVVLALHLEVLAGLRRPARPPAQRARAWPRPRRAAGLRGAGLCCSARTAGVLAGRAAAVPAGAAHRAAGSALAVRAARCLPNPTLVQKLDSPSRHGAMPAMRRCPSLQCSARRHHARPASLSRALWKGRQPHLLGRLVAKAGDVDDGDHLPRAGPAGQPCR